MRLEALFLSPFYKGGNSNLPKNTILVNGEARNQMQVVWIRSSLSLILILNYTKILSVTLTTIEHYSLSHIMNL